MLTIQVAPRPDRKTELKLIRRAQRGDQAARDVLLRSIYALVVQQAYKRKHLAHVVEDLIAEGCVGVVRAIDTFNVAKSNGARFSTYALWWISQAMSRFEWRDVTVTLPDFMQFGKKRRNKLAVYSLDVPMADDTDTSRLDMVTDPNPTAETTVAQTESQKLASMHLEAAMKGLTSRERYIIEQRFLVPGHEDSTLQILGEALGLTRERIRQLEKRAIAKMTLALKRQAPSLSKRLCWGLPTLPHRRLTVADLPEPGTREYILDGERVRRPPKRPRPRKQTSVQAA
jgi:RNA polymerase sigma factor (sigma-70 family)